jgi:hypothetical protein
VGLVVFENFKAHFVLLEIKACRRVFELSNGPIPGGNGGLPWRCYLYAHKIYCKLGFDPYP